MRVIEVVAEAGHVDTLNSIAEQHGAIDHWCGSPCEDGRRTVRMLVSGEQSQTVLDALQSLLSGSENSRILVLPVDAVLPRPEEDADAEARRISTTREELYNQIERGARLEGTFLLMVVLSTIVAAIGMIENNVAVVVGAMVIAPLLGPNIALAFATSLGDRDLLWQALRTNLAGLGLALALSWLIGLFWPLDLHSAALMARTDVGLESIALALASGAAAALSLTTGVPTALVGVMVAVALLPPTAAAGLMLGAGQLTHALGAGLLLAVNVVCVNLSAKVVFLLRGVKPRTWWEKRKARQSMLTYILVWVILLVLLVATIYLRQRLRG
ncbi:MAG TPA: TIGR00341 family protein [Gammaproteobacteria bacterium]|nr:TIGR00341 family protein [Gammaproteobacteria bacterium]